MSATVSRSFERVPSTSRPGRLGAFSGARLGAVSGEGDDAFAVSRCVRTGRREAGASTAASEGPNGSSSWRTSAADPGRPSGRFSRSENRSRSTPRGKKGERKRGRDGGARYERLSPEQMLARVVQLEKRMYEHARNLEFEQAARLRDEINDLREQSVGLPPRAVEAG